MSVLHYDLNPVFRRKGALLWPPLHPFPHFHPPCVGRRTTVLKRLSTSQLGLRLAGRRKSPRSPILPVHPLFSCSLSALHEPSFHRLSSPPDTCLHQHHPHCPTKQMEFVGFCKSKTSASLLSIEQKSVLVMQRCFFCVLETGIWDDIKVF